MKDGANAAWLLSGLPLLGALTSLLFWSNSARLKFFCIFWSILSLISIAGLSGSVITPAEGLLPLYLLPLVAIVSLLGQPVHADHRISCSTTLVFLGLGLSAVTHPPPVSSIAWILLLLVVTMLLYYNHSVLWPMSWSGIGAYGFGTFCIILSLVAYDPISSVSAVAASAVFLPLMPFHYGHLTALTRLPGNLPSFVVVVLPIVGLHCLATVLPTAPDFVARSVSILALVGALYGAIKALAQTRVRLMLGYGSLSFFSMYWWFAASTRMTSPHSALLVGTVGLATSGLLVAWQVIRTRYGDDVDPRAVSGAASGMPQYAVLLSLLALAAMGLPPFGVFAGFLGLLLSAPLPSLAGSVIALFAWLAASWYIMQMVQRLLFGPRRAELQYTDVLRTEFAALLIVALVLSALGLAPATLFTPGQTMSASSIATEPDIWSQ